MTVYVDADACPVKSEVLRVAERYAEEVVLVSNGGMRPSHNPLVKIVTVATGADAADDWIAEHCDSHDVVITADIPLASRCLEREALVLGPTGKEFTTSSIGMALAMRDVKQHLREANQSQTYNRSFTKQDASNFLQALDRALVSTKKARPKT